MRHTVFSADVLPSSSISIMWRARDRHRRLKMQRLVLGSHQITSLGLRLCGKRCRFCFRRRCFSVCCFVFLLGSGELFVALVFLDPGHQKGQDQRKEEGHEDRHKVLDRKLAGQPCFRLGLCGLGRCRSWDMIMICVIMSVEMSFVVLFLFPLLLLCQD